MKKIAFQFGFKKIKGSSNVHYSVIRLWVELLCKKNVAIE